MLLMQHRVQSVQGTHGHGQRIGAAMGAQQVGGERHAHEAEEIAGENAAHQSKAAAHQRAFHRAGKTGFADVGVELSGTSNAGVAQALAAAALLAADNAAS